MLEIAKRTSADFLQNTDELPVALPMDFSEVDVLEFASLYPSVFTTRQALSIDSAYLPGFRSKGPFIDIVEHILTTASILALVFFWLPLIVSHQFPTTTDAMLERFHR